MFQTSAQSIQLPDDKRITRTAKFDGINQAFPRIERAACRIGKNFLTARLFKRINLQIQVLVNSRDASVADFHKFRKMELNLRNSVS
jgi:hypothetical protein